MEPDLEDSVATGLRHLFVLERGRQEDFLLIFLLVPLGFDVKDVVVQFHGQVIGAHTRQLDDHGHMIGFLEDVHGRFDDLVDHGPSGLLVGSHIAERLHLDPRAAFRPSDAGANGEPVNAFQFVVTELLEPLELLALLGQFSQFLDQVGEPTQKTAAEVDLSAGLSLLFRHL